MSRPLRGLELEKRLCIVLNHVYEHGDIWYAARTACWHQATVLRYMADPTCLVTWRDKLWIFGEAVQWAIQDRKEYLAAVDGLFFGPPPPSYARKTSHTETEIIKAAAAARIAARITQAIAPRVTSALRLDLEQRLSDLKRRQTKERATP